MPSLFQIFFSLFLLEVGRGCKKNTFEVSTLSFAWEICWKILGLKGCGKWTPANWMVPDGVIWRQTRLCVVRQYPRSMRERGRGGGVRRWRACSGGVHRLWRGLVVALFVWLGFVVRSIRIFVNVYGFWVFHEGKVSFRMVSNQCQNGVAYMKMADFRAELLGNN